MRARWLSGLLVLLVLLLAGILEVAWGQTTRMEGLEKLSPEERAIAERNLEGGAASRPRERARVVENYRHWKSMSAEEQRAAKESFKRFKTLQPDEKARILHDFQRWNELPDARRQELQKAYERFQQLPPERREHILKTYRQWENDVARGAGARHEELRALEEHEPRGACSQTQRA